MFVGFCRLLLSERGSNSTEQVRAEEQHAKDHNLVYTGDTSIPANALVRGDKVQVRDAQGRPDVATVRGSTDDGRIILQDGVRMTFGENDMVPIQGLSLNEHAGRQQQGWGFKTKEEREQLRMQRAQRKAVDAIFREEQRQQRQAQAEQAAQAEQRRIAANPLPTPGDSALEAQGANLTPSQVLAEQTGAANAAKQQADTLMNQALQRRERAPQVQRLVNALAGRLGFKKAEERQREAEEAAADALDQAAYDRRVQRETEAGVRARRNMYGEMELLTPGQAVSNEHRERLNEALGELGSQVPGESYYVEKNPGLSYDIQRVGFKTRLPAWAQDKEAFPNIYAMLHDSKGKLELKEGIRRISDVLDMMYEGKVYRDDEGVFRVREPGAENKGRRLGTRQLGVWYELQRVTRLGDNGGRDLPYSTEGLQEAIEEGYAQDHGIEYTGDQMVRVDDLAPGDRVQLRNRAGEPDIATHRGYTKDGKVILKDGVERHLKPTDSIEVQGIGWGRAGHMNMGPGYFGGGYGFQPPAERARIQQARVERGKRRAQARQNKAAAQQRKQAQRDLARNAFGTSNEYQGATPQENVVGNAQEFLRDEQDRRWGERLRDFGGWNPLGMAEALPENARTVGAIMRNAQEFLEEQRREKEQAEQAKKKATAKAKPKKAKDKAGAEAAGEALTPPPPSPKGRGGTRQAATPEDFAETLRTEKQATNSAGTTYTLQALKSKGREGLYRVNAVTADGKKKVVVNKGVPLDEAIAKAKEASEKETRTQTPQAQTKTALTPEEQGHIEFQIESEKKKTITAPDGTVYKVVNIKGDRNQVYNVLVKDPGMSFSNRTLEAPKYMSRFWTRAEATRAIITDINARMEKAEAPAQQEDKAGAEAAEALTLLPPSPRTGRGGTRQEAGTQASGEAQAAPEQSDVRPLGRDELGEAPVGATAQYAEDRPEGRVEWHYQKRQDGWWFSKNDGEWQRVPDRGQNDIERRWEEQNPEEAARTRDPENPNLTGRQQRARLLDMFPENEREEASTWGLVRLREEAPAASQRKQDRRRTIEGMIEADIGRFMDELRSNLRAVSPGGSTYILQPLKSKPAGRYRVNYIVPAGYQSVLVNKGVPLEEALEQVRKSVETEMSARRMDADFREAMNARVAAEENDGTSAEQAETKTKTTAAQSRGPLTQEEIDNIRSQVERGQIQGPDGAHYSLGYHQGVSRDRTLQHIRVSQPGQEAVFYRPSGMGEWTQEEIAQEIVNLINRNLERLSRTREPGDKQWRAQRQAFADSLRTTDNGPDGDALQAAAFGDTYGIRIGKAGAFIVTENGASVFGETTFPDADQAVAALVNLVYPPTNGRKAWKPKKRETTPNTEAARNLAEAEAAYREAHGNQPKIRDGESQEDFKARQQAFRQELAPAAARLDEARRAAAREQLEQAAPMRAEQPTTRAEGAEDDGVQAQAAAGEAQETGDDADARIAAVTRKIKSLHRKELALRRELNKAKTQQEKDAQQAKLDQVRVEIRQARAQVAELEDAQADDGTRHAVTDEPARPDRRAEVKAAVDLVRRLVPGLTVRNTTDLDGELAKLKGRIRHLRNAKGVIAGAYHAGSKTVLLTQDADASTVLHEVGWHAVYDWARTNAPELHRQMQEYAKHAPKSVQDWVQERYGTFTPEGLLDEIGARMFTEQGRADFEEAVQSRAGRSWYQRVADVFRQLWNRFIGAHRADLGAYQGLTPEEAMKRLLADITAGRRLEGNRAGRGEANAARDMVVRFAKELGVSPERLQAEYDAVVAQYRDTPQWRKAPNGKDSNLNERQWVLVRTPRFKRWFGDWENDPENASQIVDANGEPMVMYHGTPESFEAFNTKGAAHTGERASFFTSNPEVAGSYVEGPFVTDKNGEVVRSYIPGGNIVPVFLNVRNPGVWQMSGGNYDHDFMRSALKDARKEKNDGVVFANMRDPGTFTLGRGKASHVVAVFKPTQIKSAIGNSGAFDPRNADIRYSKAGKAAKRILSTLRSMADGKDGTIENAQYGTILYPIGKSGNGGYGFLHIVEQRMMKDGASLEEAVELAVSVADSARDGRLTLENERAFGLVKNGVRAIVSKTMGGQPIITGYRVGKLGNKKSAGGTGGTVSQPPAYLSDAGELRRRAVAALKNKIAQLEAEVKAQDDGTRYTFAGEQGAAALDRAEEGTHRLDNLAVARDMEAAGKDPKTVKLATGWERGKDGKWRYEIDDSGNKLNERPEIGRNSTGDRMTTLARLYDAPELFKAYPDLKNMAVEFVPLNEGTRGQVVTRLGTHIIQLSDRYLSTGNSEETEARIAEIENTPEFRKVMGTKYSDPDFDDVYDAWDNSELGREYDALKSMNDEPRVKGEALSTLVHEIQHAIQKIEGFAGGGNINGNTTAEVNRQMEKRRAEINSAIETFVSTATDIENKSGLNQYRAEMNRQVRENKITRAEANDKIREWIAAQPGLSEELASIRAQIDRLQDERLSLAEEEKRIPSSPSQVYRALAGETEARNVQSRLGMTAEERRASLASETEDVAREDQIVLQEMMGTAASAEAAGEALTPLPPSPRTGRGGTRQEAATSENDEPRRDNGRPARRKNESVPEYNRRYQAWRNQQRIKEVIRLFQEAWHGSPFRFDEFTLDNIGGGEGAQVHGWGLYFALNRDVSQGYLNTLEGDDAYSFDGYFVQRQGGEWIWHDGGEINALDPYDNKAEIMILDVASEIGAKNIQEVIDYLEKKRVEIESKTMEDNEDYWRRNNSIAEDEEIPSEAREEIEEEYQSDLEDDDEYQEVSAALEMAQNTDLEPATSGQLYRVDIPEDHEMLREDADLADQPEQVKKAIEKLMDKVGVFSDDNDAALEKLRNGEQTGFDGEDLYNALCSGSEPEAASRLLNKYGIKGIRYNGGLDGECAVVFDDQAVEILETYYQAQKAGKNPLEALKKLYGQKRAEAAEQATSQTEQAQGIFPHRNPGESLPDYIQRRKQWAEGRKEQLWNQVKEQIRNILPDRAQANAIIGIIEARAKSAGISAAEFVHRRGLEFRQGKTPGDLLAQGEKLQGAFSLRAYRDEGRAVISAFEAANVSTLAHELAHMFRQDLERFGQKNLLKAAEKWAGVKDGKWTREQEEKFARAFEKYLREGKAPTNELKSVFARFRDWLTNIYRTLKGSPLDVRLSPEITRVFDALLTENAALDQGDSLGMGATESNPGDAETFDSRTENKQRTAASSNVQQSTEMSDKTAPPLKPPFRTPWTDETAEAVVMAPHGAAQKSEWYEAAKKGGDPKAAYEVVLPLITQEGIENIRTKLHGSKDVVVVPVVSEERLGKNMIPRAYAEVLADALGISSATDIVHINKVNRGGSDGFHRLAAHPTFAGPVEAGKKYIIVDDTIAQGGTLAALKGYIETNGGKVVVVAALTGKQYSARLKPDQATIEAIRAKYPTLEEFWHEHFGYGFDLLTNSEANYLRAVKRQTADSIRDRILEESGQGSEQDDQGPDSQGQGDGSILRGDKPVTGGNDGTPSTPAPGGASGPLAPPASSQTGAKERGADTTDEDPDTLYQTTPAANNTITGQSFVDRILDHADPKWRDRWERFIYNFIDNNDPRERVWKKAGAPTDQDFVTVERLRGKKAAAEQKKFREEMVTPMLQTLGKGGLAVSDLEEYAHAMHTPERNQKMREVNAKRNLDALRRHMPKAEAQNLQDQIDFVRTVGKQNGWTTRDIQNAYLGMMENVFQDIPRREALAAQAEANLTPTSSKNARAHVEKLKRDLAETKRIRDAWRKESIRFAGQTDQEAQATIDKWKKDSRFATLQKAHKQLEDITAATLDVLHEAGYLSDEEFQEIKNGYQHYVPLHRDGFLDTTPIKLMQVAKGSMRDVVHIVSNVVRSHETAVNRKHRAAAGKALYEFAEAFPDAGISIEEMEMKPTHDQEGNIVMYRSQAEPEDGIFVRVNGKQYLLRFAASNKTPEGRTLLRFLESVKGSDAQLGGMTKALHEVTKWLAMVNTSLSPEFMVTNFARDLQTAFIHLNQKDIDMDGLKTAVAHDIFPAMKGIWAAERGDKSSSMAKWYADFQANGGKVGWMQGYEEAETLTKDLQEEMKLYQDGHHTLKARKKLMKLVESGNAAIENCMRLATYKNLVERGISKDKAARIASSLTVDFTQHGKMGPQINALYMFWNASVQGSVRMVQALASSKKVRAIAGGIAGAGFVLQMLALAGGGDDDSGEPYILGIPDAIRERNIIIMLPGGEGKYIKIPKAYGYGAIYDFGAELANSIYMGAQGRKYDHTKGAMRVVNSFANSFNPIQSATMLQTLAPTLLDPVAYVAENRTWAGTPLMPEQNPYGPPKPDSERFWKGTSPVWKKTVAAINDLTGGDKYQSGWADVSPETLSMIWDNATGGMGRFIGNTLSLPFTIATGDTEAHKVPFARQVFGTWNDRAISSRYYEAMDRAEIAHMRFKNAENLAERKRLYATPEHKLYLKTRQTEKLNFLTCAFWVREASPI